MSEQNKLTLDMIDSEFPKLQNDLFLRAARKEEIERVPVWIMRQAGRYLPEFRQLKEENKDKDFFGICKTPELCCELTLQPIRRYKELDAAIIFSDILVIPQAMGLEVEMKPAKGPVFPSPLLTPEEIETRLVNPNVKESLGYVFQAITMTRKKLEGKVPLIGFTGAPWTLMSYMVEGQGSKTFSKAKSWLFLHPESSHKLLQKITTIIIEYLICQVQAGAQALQVFDSWSGELGPDTFQEFCYPYLKQICDGVKQVFPEIPMIVFAKGSNYALESLSKLNYNVVGLDWTMDPFLAREKTSDSKLNPEDASANPRVTLQGNLDPCILFGSKETIEKNVEAMLKKFGTKKGLIANLGHGLLPEHNPTNVGYFLEAIHKYSKNNK